MTQADILKQQGAIGVQMIAESISKLKATGKTDQSVRFESDDKSIQIYARPFTELLESGRRPTSKGPSPEMIDNLTEYAEARGMENPKSAAWAIAKKINKVGDKTFRKGGRVVYSKTVEKVKENISAAIILFKMREAKKQVLESVK